MEAEMNNQIKKQEGFTMIELSIVLVIIGLLLAGITAGAGLIKQSELNSIVTDMRNYQSAYNAFILRYSSVPGDMTSVEGTAWAATGTTPCAVTATSCNGNGNGTINFNLTGVGPYEIYPAWKELSLAGFISAGIVAVPDNLQGVGLGGIVVIGQNVPESKYQGAGYIMTGDVIGGGGATLSPWTDGANAIFIGTVDSSGMLGGAALSPSDAFNLDQKIDDGIILGLIESPFETALNFILSPALARKSSGSGNYQGANTGSFRATTGWQSSDVCTNGSRYNPTSSTNAICVSGMALN